MSMVSVFWPDGRSGVREVELVTEAGRAPSSGPAAPRNATEGGDAGRSARGRVRIRLDDGRTDEYTWEDA
jgi:hypothetical protein